jgi:hypothetical protein
MVIVFLLSGIKERDMKAVNSASRKTGRTAAELQAGLKRAM